MIPFRITSRNRYLWFRESPATPARIPCVCRPPFFTRQRLCTAARSGRQVLNPTAHASRLLFSGFSSIIQIMKPFHPVKGLISGETPKAISYQFYEHDR